MLLPAKAFSYSNNAVTKRLHKKLYSFYDLTNTLVIAMVISVLLFTFVITTATVDGQSMEPTFYNGQRLLVTPYPLNIKRGDVVLVAQDKTDNPAEYEPLLKRVIGVGGDIINIDFDAGIVYVNGEPLDEPYAKEPIHLQAIDSMTFPLTVDEGCIFVLGDNRNASRDSRAQSVGIIDTRYVYGKVFLRYYPINQFEFFRNPYQEKEGSK